MRENCTETCINRINEIVSGRKKHLRIVFFLVYEISEVSLSGVHHRLGRIVILEFPFPSAFFFIFRRRVEKTFV